MSVGWIRHDFFLLHETGRGHPEQPGRLDDVAAGLDAPDLAGRLEPISFGPADRRDVELVHEPAYVDLVRLACEKGFSFVGSEDTRICAESYDVALVAAGGVIAACDAAMEGRLRRAFCAVRPPGHHAERDRALGFCLFNHVAIAAEHLRRRRGLERIAIVDLDAHHGNGTQSIFYERDDVLYASIHEHPETLFPGTGWAEETGRGRGEGFTLNVPLRFGAGGPQYREVFDRLVLPRLEEFRPEFILVSAGFDASREESISHLALEPEDFGWMTADLVTLAERHAAGRLVSVLEGGYEPSSLRRSAAAHVAAL